MDNATLPTTTVSAREVSGGVLDIHLSGGRRRNVLGRATIARIEQLVSIPPEGTRSILFSAEGPDFCAGYDLLEASEGDPLDLLANEERFASLRLSKVPIVAALHGNVIGGGMELALLADIRLAAPDVKFAIPASKLGLIYSEAGIRLIVNSVGENIARALLLGGREINADGALSIGLITEIVSRDCLEARSLEVAKEVASWSPLATSGNRELLDFVVGRSSRVNRELRAAISAPESELRINIKSFLNKPRS